MAIDKRTPRNLNQDSDNILVTSLEMTDARNIRVSMDATGNGGVIKNIKGNQSITLSTALPIGSNKVVGVCEYDAGNELYFYVWNSLENHTLWRYSPRISANAQLILQSDALELYAHSQLHCNAVVVFDKLYIYTTDGVSEPKKVNITAALAGGYPAGVTKTQRLVELTVSKNYPIQVTAAFSTNPSRSLNNLFGKSFQFVAQYVYRDGEYSALGNYSDLYVSTGTLDNINRSENVRSLYNKLTLTVPVAAPTAAISAVKFYMRENSVGTFYYIGESLSSEFVSGNASLVFYDDGAYPAIADSEFNKLEDSVPRKAQAQAMVGNRLTYGNYVEGFNVTKPTATIVPEYNNVPHEHILDLQVVSTDVADRVVAYWNLENVPDTSESIAHFLVGDSIIGESNYVHGVNKSLTLTTEYGTFTNTTTLKFNVGQYVGTFSFEITPSTSRADAAAKFIAAFPNLLSIPVETTDDAYATFLNDTVGGQGWNIYYVGNILIESVSQAYIPANPDATFNGKPVVKFVWKVKEINLVAYKAELASSTDPTDPIGQFFSNVNSSFFLNNTADEAFAATGIAYIQKKLRYLEHTETRTFKANDTHGFGIVYYDNRGRSSGVKPLGSVGVSGLHDPIRLGKRGFAGVKLTMTSPAPTWASKFSIVYDGGSNYDSYTQYSVIEAMTSLDDDSKLSASKIIYVSIRGLQGKDQSYVEGEGAKIRYAYAEGDRMRVIRYRTGDTEYKYPLDLEFEIVGFSTFDDPTTSKLALTGSATADVQNMRKTGDFIKIKAIDYAGFTYAEVDTDGGFFHKHLLVEIYSPKKVLTTNSVYYAINGLVDISTHSTPIILVNGNSWYNRRNVKQLTWNSTVGVKTSKTLIDIEEYVESAGFSDFSEHKASTKGKPYGVIENGREVTRYSSITYSEPFFQDSSRLWLSSFNNSLANWADYSVDNGGIYGLVGTDQSIMMLQEDKVSVIPINKQIITTASNSTLVGLSTSFLGNAQYYEGKFGIGKDRGSFVSANGDVYIFDVQRGAVYQLGEKGVSQISSRGMSSYFETIGRELTDFVTQQIGGGFSFGGRNLYNINMANDAANNEILVSVVKGVESVVEDPELAGPYHLITWDYSKPAIAFDYESNQWASFHDVTSDAFGVVSNTLYHFKTSGTTSIIWASQKNNTHSNFFGVQKTAYFETVFNISPSNRKVYQALSIDGDQPADVTISTKAQTASIAKEAFSLMEDEYFVSCPRVGGNNEYVALGTVIAKSGNTITFANRINRLPFRLSGEVFGFVGSSYITKATTIQSVPSPTSILVSNAVNISIGDSLSIAGSSQIDGDPLRGAWAKTKFDFPYSTGLEVFSVAASISDSKLHSISVDKQ